MPDHFDGQAAEPSDNTGVKVKTVLVWIFLFACASAGAATWRGLEWLSQPMVGIWLESPDPPEPYPSSISVYASKLTPHPRFQEISQEVALRRVDGTASKCELPHSIPIPPINQAAINIIQDELHTDAMPSAACVALFADRFNVSPRERDWRGQVKGYRAYPENVLMDFRLSSATASEEEVAGRKWLARRGKDPTELPRSLVLRRFRAREASTTGAGDWDFDSLPYRFPVSWDGRNIFWLADSTPSADRCPTFALPILPLRVVQDWERTEAKERNRFLTSNLTWNLWGRAGAFMTILLAVRYRKWIFRGLRVSANTAAAVTVRSSRAIDDAERRIRDR